ncbi:glycosyltransferase [Leisingera sp. MMG026]|uniref:glycosyltransferase family 2 protein n=1 Tax=Leisingera sp. MMG026 TaxID=2909982 RepID=UPI001F31FFFF|nr:glycosyltransferase [Leisingera sp. MMG026]MCF6430618.1 glycosyltransferase [Leisingera sp. MMG026]
MKPAAPVAPPRATIVIAAYNAEATLERALRSAFAQTVPVEVVVVDDASQDGTADLAERLCRSVPRAMVLRQPRNAGPAAARNRAIEAATAPWIAVLDADDHMAPDRIARLAAEAEAGALDCLADDLYMVTEADPAATARRLWSPDDFGRMQITLAFFASANTHGSRGQRGELGFIKPLMRRAFLQQNGLRYAEDLRLAEDYILYARALAAGAAFRLVDPRGYFAVYRENSLSGCHSTDDLGALVQADRRLLSAPELDRSARAAIRLHCREVHKEWVWRRMIDAVRARDLRSMAALWLSPPAVSAALLGKLLEQAWLRGRRRLGLGRRES